ncbi:MAG: cation-translocating P-type ATPase [Candidatus Eremiobacterota bacterium]
MNPTHDPAPAPHPEPLCDDHGHGHDHDGEDHHHDYGHEREDHDHHHGVERTDLIRIALVGICVLATWLRPDWRALSLAAIALGGWPIYRHALQDLLRRRMTMELSMTVALVGALLLGELLTVLVIVFFVLLAEALEGLTVERGHRALSNLLQGLPQTAWRRRGDSLEEVSTADLAPGDRVVVRPGALLPVDGVVREGHSFVDQASVTGEPLPAEKLPGAAVYAGTLNQAGSLEVEVHSVGRETAFGRILEAVERAEASRAPVQKLADQLAGWLVYVALGGALLTYLATGKPLSAISVLLVAGACGVAAGTPLALLGALGRTAQLGAVVKGSLHLEALGKVDTVVLDKTGTLTVGEARVASVHPAEGVTPAELLSAAAAAEALSEHPLARAVLEHAREHGVEAPRAESFCALPGRGLTCTVRGEEVLVGNETLFRERGLTPPPGGGVLVALGGQTLGRLQIEDRLRPESVDAVQSLIRRGYRVILLTGDSRTNAGAVAGQLGIREVHAEVLPEHKSDLVRRLRKEGRVVAMVGDGINDAAALMEADVGVAMGSGTDLTRESAGVILLGNDLGKLARMLALARRCRGIILANFAGTLAVDAAGMLLAAFGFLTPLWAALIHVGSELVFLLNSARLLPYRSR